MPTRVLIALDIRDDQAADQQELIASIEARVKDEAGYLESDGGYPIMPTQVTAAVVEEGGQLTPLTEATLAGIYEVGVEGAPDA